MNMATGVFIERASQKANEYKGVRIANKISEIFFNDPEMIGNEVTLEHFTSKVGTEDMRDYFKSINVDPSEVQKLFKLMDADDIGAVDAEELVDGCLRLGGGAKA